MISNLFYSVTEGADSGPGSGAGTPTEDKDGNLQDGKGITLTDPHPFRNRSNPCRKLPFQFLLIFIFSFLSINKGYSWS